MKDTENFPGELKYIQRRAELDAARILLLNTHNSEIRYELEHKRRGFALISDLASNLWLGGGSRQVFDTVAGKTNAALNMQRTAILTPNGDGTFSPSVIHGYPAESAEGVLSRRIEISGELLSGKTVRITGADPAELFKELRDAIEIPYVVSAPVYLGSDAAAVLITGRMVEQPPFLLRLGESDAETVGAIGSYMSAALASQRFVEVEERVMTMFNATPIGCDFWSDSLTLIDCNDEALRLLRISSKEEYLSGFWEFSPVRQPDGKASRESALEKLKAAFSSGYERFEWTHQTSCGEMIPVEKVLVRVKYGGKTAVLSWSRDLREYNEVLARLRRHEEELRVALGRAEESGRAKGEFLANISHEIRTPLNVIMSMINNMSDARLDDRQRKSVDMASSSARALASVINNILDFSALDGGRAGMANTVFSVGGVVRASVDSFRARAEAKSLTLLANVLPCVPEMVEGDEARVRQVLDNLIENAIKFTKFGGVIADASLMAVHGDRVQILFNVSDTGIGIDDDRADRIFKPFTQIDGSFTREFGGAGLGLAIIKRIVELMDGKIWFDSTPGDGSKFSFYVTLKPAQRAACEEACPRGEETGETGDLNGMRVLLVEDNEMNQMIAEELLSEMGAETTIANNGLEALDILRKESFNIVLMDIQMPEMDGITATINIRRNPAYAGLPILALTAHSLPSDRDKSLSSGMNDHLSKPIDAKILYSALKRWGKR
ncbi:hypothetical protein FACS1894216_03700 [Synergistales bacterium]|nr:hypothetical protein FACS1894216_03700 [Synergistales bacterium]